MTFSILLHGNTMKTSRVTKSFGINGIFFYNAELAVLKEPAIRRLLFILELTHTTTLLRFNLE